MTINDENSVRPPGGAMALASLVTGIAAIFACGLGIIAGPVAVVLGVVSGRRSGFGGKQIGGIVTGAFAFIVSAVALVAFLLFLSGRNDPEFVQPTPSASYSEETLQPTADASAAGTLLTEAGIAAAGFDTAYAAYLDAYGVSTSFDGMFQGDAIETPCFTMDGEAWWVEQGTPAACEPSSELWWETKSGAAEPEIKLFGSGAAGAAISFEALKTDFLMTTFDSTDLRPVSDYVRDSLLPESGATAIVETPIELGGLPAVQFDCSIGQLAAYRLDVVMLPEPRILDDGTEIRGFIIHAYNEAEWVYGSDDVFARLDNTLVWK